ncbi:DUF2851 family protein [Parapedobacter deserti]|uniref:DUF2851 family protein n=1 Tax=Parapedobacter deserti TaxID=1912957 RepID=A0ABV7JDW8_9SPHI
MVTLSEDILHFIWKYRLYHHQHLCTVSGKSLTVLETGVHNRNAGADFLSARMRIGDMEWSGNVEIHVHASDWYAHKHQRDNAYNNVVLHVVYENDRSVNRADGTVLECLELKPLIPTPILHKYRELMSGMYWIPCEKLISTVSSLHLTQWLTRLLVERFERKVAAFYEVLNQQQGNWEETCYIWIARYFGSNVNAQAFDQLARSLPSRILAKHKDRPLAIEALFFGQAGFLENTAFEEEYPRRLQEEYHYLRKLHSLMPMDASVWKFMRVRPGNFPSIRIAQFAALCARAEHLFSAIVQTECTDELKALFEALPVNPYWLRHYRFDAASPLHSCQLGVQFIDMLLINVIAGILFAYGKYIGKEMYIYRAVRLLENLKAESNAIIKRFSKLGVGVKQASESQALLQMKAYYCDKKKCLDCGVGVQLIKHNERW